MPFQSEKQRRYLHANHPEIANRWEAKYGLGGIAELNSQLNQLPEYYLPKNQGGRIGFGEGTPKIPEQFLEDLKKRDYHEFLEKYRRWKENYERRKDLGVTQEAAHGGFIPSHEAGIYGLAEGGNIRLQPHTASDLLVQKTLSGERPKYQPPGHVDAPAPSSSGGGGGDAGHLSHNVSVSLGGTKPDTVTRDAGDAGHLTHNVPVSLGGTKPDTDNKDNYYKDQIIQIAEKNKKTKELRDKASKEGFHQFLTSKAPPKKKSGFWGFLGKGILSLATAGAGAGLFGKDLMKVAKVVKWGKNLKNAKTALKTGKFKIGKKEFNISNLTNKLTSSDQKLMASLPKGHPERIALEAQMKVKAPPTDDRDGSSIKIENIETVNAVNDEQAQLKKYLDMEMAAKRAMVQQQEDRSKQMAYWQTMMKPYMSAKGGRVPAGYNTGGLSNLFRLKNR